MTVITPTVPDPQPEPSPPGRVRKRALLVGAGVAAVVLGFLLVRWLRRGGPERVVRELAEHEAVVLADAAVDRLFAA
jgi:hypothetical protein